MPSFTNFTDQQIHDYLAGLVTFAVVAWGLYLLLRWLRGARPGLRASPNTQD